MHTHMLLRVVLYHAAIISYGASSLLLGCGPATAQLDTAFNAIGTFSGAPGTAQIDTASNAPINSQARGIALSPDATVILGGRAGSFAAAKLTLSGGIIWQTTVPELVNNSTFTPSVAVDPSGLVYLGGNSNGHFAAAQLSSTGATTWATIVDSFGPSSFNDARGVAIDQSGCVYLGGAIASHFAAAKLSNTGGLVWTAVLSPFSSGSNDQANAMTTDQSGCVLLAGFSNPFGPDTFHFAVAKLTSAGGLVWTAIVPHLNSGSSDTANGIALNQSGCILLGGVSSSAGSAQFAAAKLSYTGGLLWTAVLPAFSPNSIDVASAITVDAFGRSYLGGRSDPPLAVPPPYFAAAKLSDTGALLWTAIVPHFTTDSTDLAGGITVDSSGHSYLAGFSDPISVGFTPDFAFAALGSTGTTLHKALVPFTAEDTIAISFNGVAHDADNNIILGGQAGASPSSFFVYKLTPAGEPLWNYILPHFSTNSNDFANDVAVDTSGCIYLGGTSDNQFAAAKLSSTGNLIWTSVLAPFSPGSLDAANGIALDASGCIYLGGTTDPAIASQQMAIAKLSSTGALIWTAVIPNFISGSRDSAAGVVIDSSGCAYLGGYALILGVSLQMAAAKLSATGSPIWTAIIPNFKSGSREDARDIVLDSYGHINLGGGFTDLTTGEPDRQSAAVQLSNTGAIIWTALLPVLQPGSTEVAFSIAVDQYDCLYLGGKQDDTNNSRFATAKFTNEGSLVWQVIAPIINGNTSNNAQSLAVDTDNKIILAGKTSPFGSFFGGVVKLLQIFPPPPLSPLLALPFMPMGAA